MADRTATEVIEDHLAKRLTGDIEGDIETNFSENVVLLTSFGFYHGQDGVRESAKKLAEVMGDGVFHYKHTLIEKNYGFLEWTGEASDKIIQDGADSFVVENGKITMQTIHYTARDV